MRNLTLLAASACLAALTSVSAFADTILPTYYSLSVTSGSQTTQQSTSGTLNGSGASASAGPSADGPSVSVSGSTGGSGPGVEATAIASWDFAIIGPTNGTGLVTDIPLVLTGNYTLAASGTGISSIGIGFGGPDGLRGGYGEYFTPSCGVDPGCGSSPLTVFQTEQYGVGTNVFSVVISASGYIDASAAGSFLATVDPIIAIDWGAVGPNEDLSGFSLLVSPDALPVSNTPLPATLPLFAAGLGLLGPLVWRTKKKAAAVSV